MASLIHWKKETILVMEDKILIKMARFDFSAPVETITFYEDDFDEESCSHSKKIKYEDEETDNSINSPSESTSQEVNNHSLENSEKQRQKVTVTVNNCINDFNVSDVNQECSLKLANKVDGKSDDKIDNNINEQEKVQDSTTQLSSKELSETEEIMPEKVSTVTIPATNRQNNDMEIMGSYLKKLMDTVSEYLLIIIRAQRIYLHSQKTGNQKNTEKWKEHYFQVKYHYFKLSFTTVEIMFMPQGKLYTFAQRFIECTIRLASKNFMNCTYDQIEPLYFEMLEWIKEKSKKFRNFAHSLISSTEEIQRKLNKNAHQIDHISLNKSTNNILQLQNQQVWDRRQYPILKSMIHPSSTIFEETIHSAGGSSNINHNHKNDFQQQKCTYGIVPQLNSCCNNNVYNTYSSRTHPDCISRPLNGPYGYPNCGYYQRTLSSDAMEEPCQLHPVITQVKSLDPKYTMDTTLKTEEM